MKRPRGHILTGKRKANLQTLSRFKRVSLLVVLSVLASAACVGLPGELERFFGHGVDSGSAGSEAVEANPVPPPGRDGVLWEANHEKGDISEWLLDQSGAVFNSGTGKVEASRSVAYSGEYSLAMSITGASGQVQAARIFRWAENAPAAYYSTWMYLMEPAAPAKWWNVFQFKTKVGPTSHPTWVLNIGHRENGEMYFYLWDSIIQEDHAAALHHVLPIGEWFHVEVYLEQGDSASGRITVWLDGDLLLDLEDVQTTLGDNVQWSLANYTNDVTPADQVIYFDDAAISTRRLGPSS